LDKKYENTFREQGWDNLDELMNMDIDERKKNFVAAKLSHGAQMKIINKFQGYITYKGTYEKQLSMNNKNNNKNNSNKRKIKDIINECMDEDWKPDPSQNKDRSQEFEENGKVSVRSVIKRIAEGYKLRGVSDTDANVKFYVRSSNHQRWFLITVIYQS